MASIPLVEGRHALRGEKPNRSTLKQGCGGCRDRSEFKNRTEQSGWVGIPGYPCRLNTGCAAGKCVLELLSVLLHMAF